MIPLVGPGESLGYILVYLFGPLIMAALGSAFVAAASAYAVALLGAVAIEALALGTVVGVILPPREGRHWIIRPMAMGGVLAVGATLGVALTLWLMLDDEGQLSSLLVPFAPAALAGLVAAIAGTAIVVRGVARWRRAGEGLDARRRTTSAVRTFALAAARAASTVGFGLAWLLAVGAVFGSRGSDELSTGDGVLLAMVSLTMVGGLASLLAWAGRRRPSPGEPAPSPEPKS